MKARYLILAIVEGHGEERAVPVLLRRWFLHRRYHNFETRDLAIRAPGSGALKCPHDAEEDLGIESYVAIAAAERPDGILVVLDADDECRKREKTSQKGLGPELRDRARAVAPHIPIDQPDFTEALPFTPGMSKRSPSYGKLMRALAALTRAARARRTRS